MTFTDNSRQLLDVIQMNELIQTLNLDEKTLLSIRDALIEATANKWKFEVITFGGKLIDYNVVKPGDEDSLQVKG